VIPPDEHALLIVLLVEPTVRWMTKFALTSRLENAKLVILAVMARVK